MASNLTDEQKVNYYVQLTLIIICFLLGITIAYSIILVAILPILGFWQIIDFGALWLNTGYKKWYKTYLVLVAVAIVGFYFTKSSFSIFYVMAYTWIVACIYLAIRSKS